LTADTETVASLLGFASEAQPTAIRNAKQADALSRAQIRRDRDWKLFTRHGDTIARRKRNK
jgi:hypothetical protein